MSPEHSVPSISIFGGAYNAKTKTLKEIAERFIPPTDSFSRLIQPDNTVLIGPRGSGKTTLLSMLQGRALDLWPGATAEKARTRVTYTGVLVPCDRSWAEQLRSLTVGGDLSKTFSTALFVLHTLRCLAAAGATRLESDGHGAVPGINAMEHAKLAQRVARAWRLESPVTTLREVEREITLAIAQLHSVHSEMEWQEPHAQRARVAGERMLHLSLVPSLLAFVELFNEVAREREGRWACLFDELELAPPYIADMVLQLLRGVDRRLLFKVSYAPYEGGIANSPHGPQEAQDYSVIRLFFANKRKGFDFTRQLIQRRLDELGSGLTPRSVFGETSVIDEDDDEPEPSPATYAPDAPAGRLLAALNARDETFRVWLRENQIDLATLPEAPEPLRARVRKVMPTVALRLEGSRGPSNDAALRSRRNVDLYSGEEALLAMVEANPRWCEHICDELLNRPYQRSLSVPKNDQSRLLHGAGQEFMSYLTILPVPGTHLGPDDAPRRLLERIGKFFRDAHLRGGFSPDVPGSIVLDEKLGSSVFDMLQALIDRGALIEVPNKRLPSVGPLIGRRYRLAYLIAPQFQLPLRLDKGINLSTVLQRTRGNLQMHLSEDDG